MRQKSSRQARWCRRGQWIGLAVILLSMLSLAPYATSWTEIVRMRNALLVIDGPDSDFDWTPATRPASFEIDSKPFDPVFVEAARQLQLDALPDDWARAVAISQHLLTSSKRLVGGAIQADLRSTYRRIIHGEGYCADFVRAFNALAVSSGIPVRSWAFSFDGFGGHGHVFPEIWNRQLARWQLVDVFDNLAVVDAQGNPLSALEFRRVLFEKSTTVQLRRLVASAPLEFVHTEQAWEYFRQGAPEWYLWWGEHPFAYDRAATVRAFEGSSRSLAQLGAIVQGVHPRIRILTTAQNAPQVAALRRVKAHLMIAAGLTALAIGAIALCTGIGLVGRRRGLKGGAAIVGRA